MRSNEEKKKLIEQYWSISTIQFPSRKIRSLYSSKFMEWLENALIIRKKYPLETGKYWADLINSEFTLIFITKSHQNKKKAFRKWSIDRKIRFIKDTFENGYPYFGFLTHCNNYKDGYFKKIDQNWYKPLYQKDNLGRIIRKKNERHKKLINKQWVLRNCPLFDSLDKDGKNFINQIRNKDSHADTIIKDDKVFALKNGAFVDETDQVNHICEYLLGCIQVAFHFHLFLLIELDFWMFPLFIYGNHKAFGYEVRKIDFNSINLIIGRKIEEYDENEKLIATKKLLNFIIPLYTKLYKLLISKKSIAFPNSTKEEIESMAINDTNQVLNHLLMFGLKGIWERFGRNEESINGLLKKIGRKLESSMLKKLEEKTLVDFRSVFGVSVYHILSGMRGIDKDSKLQEVIKSKGQEPISKEVLTKIFQEVNQFEHRRPDNTLVFLLLTVGYGIIGSSGNIYHNFKLLTTVNLKN